MAFMRDHGRILLALALLAVGLAPPFHDQGAHAHEGIRAAAEPPTRFEQFLLSGCVPCVTESHLVATVPTGAPKISGLPRSGGAKVVLEAAVIGVPDAMLELTSFLEQTFGIKVEDEELVPDNLDSLMCIEQYVQRKLAGVRT